MKLEPPVINNKRISREFFRVPMNVLDDMTVHITDRPFKIINISAVGISIYLPAGDVFSEGDFVNPIELNVEGNHLTCQGMVRHISPHDSGGYVCGIELIATKKREQRLLMDLFQKIRDHVLTSSMITS